jgi:hypothetical protein
MPRIIMQWLCLVKVHSWQPDSNWASRVCLGCGNTEILMYTRENGTFWERIT